MNNKRYPSYSGFCIWGGASTVVYNFFPTAASYVSGTGVITFTYKNHLLVTGDIVNVIDVNGSTFDSNNEAVTVIDPNTFTVAVNTGLTGFLDPSVYQNAGSFRIDVPEYSVYNNTVYSNAAAVNIWGVRLIDSEVENTDVRNNILYAPNVTGQARTVSDLGTNTIGASGTFGNSSQAQAEGIDPLFVNSAAGTRAGFSLQTGSPYIGSGDVNTPVYIDAFMQKIGFGDSQRTIDSGAIKHL